MPSYKVRWDRTTSNDATLVQFFETSHPGCTSRTANKVGCAMIIRDPFSVFHFCFFSVFRFFFVRFAWLFLFSVCSRSAPRGRNVRFGSDSSQAPLFQVLLANEFGKNNFDTKMKQVSLVKTRDSEV